MRNPRPGAVPIRHNGGPALRGQSPRGTVSENTSRSRWKCPDCGSQNVQIRLPVWFSEYQDGELVEVSIDGEADPQAYYCEDCFACENGFPVLFEAEAPAAVPPATPAAKTMTRDFHGYFQCRTGGIGPWRFYVCGFSGPPHANGTDSLCRLLRSDGTNEDCVPIDDTGHVTILGRKYGRDRWDH
jgi:hypothetical protein